MPLMKSIVVMGALASGTALAGSPPQPQPQPIQPVEVACRGVPETDSHLAVLMGTTSVVRIQQLRGGVANPDTTVPRGDGARVVIGARAFTTEVWLQAIVDCHQSRNVALGPVRAAAS